jgi:hypothetical protein
MRFHGVPLVGVVALAVAASGVLVTAPRAVSTVSGQQVVDGSLPGLVDGVEIESHDHVPPMMDSNGNLYRVSEDYLAGGNRPMVSKSSDGGSTWVEQDAENRPTTGDTEGGWALQDGTAIWFAWQKSSDVYLMKFRTSDHPSAPDTYAVQTEPVASPSDPGPQYASLARTADGGLWIAYGASASEMGPQSAYRKRAADGSYGVEAVIDAGVATTAPRLVEGAGDVTHIVYKDHTHHRIYARRLSHDGVLSAPIRLDAGGTHSTETPLTNVVSYLDGGVEVLVVAFADPSGVLKAVEVRDGVAGAEQTISSGPVLLDPGETTNLAAVAHLAVTGSTVHVMWADRADGHVWRDHRFAGETWGADILAVDTGPGTSSQAQYVYCSTFADGDGDGEAVLGFTYDLGPHADDDSNIYYDQVAVASEAPATNRAPVVDVGGPLSVKLPAAAALDATISRDGLPVGSSVTSRWLRIAGPGQVGFADPHSADTTASFSEPGSYVLRLVADDSELTGFADLNVTVRPADLALTLRARPGTVTASRSVRLTGRLYEISDGAAATGEAVRIYVTRAPGSHRRLLRTVTARADGTFALSDAPRSTTRYIAVHTRARSTTRRVSVRPHLTARLTAAQILAGSRTRITGTIRPTATATPLLLQRWNGRRWATVQRRSLPRRDRISYRFTVRHRRTGTFRYRVVAPAHGGRIRATAPSRAAGLRVSVYNAKIVRVKPRGDEYVVIANTGRVRLNLNHWKLRNMWNNRAVTLPPFTLRPGARVRVHTGRGRTTRHHLYLRRRPMWGTHDGIVVLRDRRGHRVDRLRY